ncbi:hypothetical protein N7539_008174 [Penicillium diatomitis]|uniref:Peroxisomal membrane protein 4 n=1 Tax=Penicillium diatomitis TaxID=2819901 RepID=A0A9X0BN89_9EURO|nr:uncharacterized protein N7539_008174 [Penicillium diatomitis]KAJ5475108.1 hypothetical protein N7539_008174 [Penicillium diatomitis]
MDALTSRLDALVLNPELAPLLSLVKGARNGIVYGSKVRFPHALVMIFLFRSGTFREKVKLVLNATRLHARNLATFATIYKASMIILRNLPAGQGKEGRYDSFFAGLLGGYAVFGRQRGSISQQVCRKSPHRGRMEWKGPRVKNRIALPTANSNPYLQIVIYVFARVMLSLAKLSVQPGMHPLSSLITPQARTSITDNAWPVFASMSWALVMYLFRWYPETLASSLRSSMVYIYADSDHWNSFRNLLIHNK